MATPIHETLRYENAAREYCYRIGEQPYTMTDVQRPGGTSVMVWQVHAERMAELAAMLEEMRKFGVAPL